jgi:hypothetical protein
MTTCLLQFKIVSALEWYFAGYKDFINIKHKLGQIKYFLVIQCMGL